MATIDHVRMVRIAALTIALAVLPAAISCAPQPLSPAPPAAVPAENLDFEQADGTLPAGWNLRSEGYTIELDSTTVHEGLYSLLIRSDADGGSAMAPSGEGSRNWHVG